VSSFGNDIPIFFFVEGWNTQHAVSQIHGMRYFTKRNSSLNMGVPMIVGIHLVDHLVKLAFGIFVIHHVWCTYDIFVRGG
jgi:hypothetical protein